MYYYNMNQISRMKIRKNEFVQELTASALPEHHIENIVYPFIPQIATNEINVFLARMNDWESNQMIGDWTNYKLILFNIFQNAVKYNNEKGVIVILLSLNHDVATGETMFETEVIDTGLGIAVDR